jgi:hypothetical protein
MNFFALVPAVHLAEIKAVVAKSEADYAAGRKGRFKDNVEPLYRSGDNGWVETISKVDTIDIAATWGGYRVAKAGSTERI